MRLRFIPDGTSLDFFARWRLWLGISAVLVVLSFGSFLVQGLNYGIDFRGGTAIRTDSSTPLDVGTYRNALSALELGDVAITEVLDPTFGPDQHVASIRIAAVSEEGSITPEQIGEIEQALLAVDPNVTFTSVESVGPKVSAELIRSAAIAVSLALAGILFYVWLRFEWQFAIAAVAALFHDVLLTIGIFSVLRLKFDLTTIAALLTIVGYSINDTVVIFDRVREVLRKYKTMPLKEILNLAINETLSRTFMTSATTLLALVALFALGGDVIRGFVFAMIWGIFVGTYSTVFVASALLLYFGVKRDWSKPSANQGNRYADIDA